MAAEQPKNKPKMQPEFHNLSRSEQEAYEDSLKYYRDLKNSLDTAMNEGFEKAAREFQPALEEERRQKEEERRQKEEERRQKHSLAIKLAQQLKKAGTPISDIAKETGLSEEEIRRM